MVRHRFFFTNVNKEENWINGYISRGYRLIDINPLTKRYRFEKTTDNDVKHTIKIDFRIFKKQEEFEDYITMFEDSGWKHIAGNKSNGTQYFERERADASEDIFSDHLSKAERSKRLSDMWLGSFWAFIPTVVVFYCTGIIDVKKIIHIKELYYTPGLWDMKGFDFWRAFLFETPFALGRGFAGFLFLFIVLAYGYFGIKSLYWYYKERNSK